MNALPTKLFGRVWAVSVGLSGEVGKKYAGLRTVFEIDKTSTSSSNKAKIKLYNLNPESRKEMQRKGLRIRLDAGYQGIVETLYLGEVVLGGNSSREGDRDIATLFECGDAESNLILAKFDKSYPVKTRYLQVVKDLAAALDVNIGTVIGIQEMVYNSGISFSGSVKGALDKLLKKQGLEWSIQNNYLQIIPVTAHNGDEAQVISDSTGLIGIPTNGNDSVNFTALLNPRLMPGAPVKLESENISGYFKVRRAKFEGDSHGDKWQVACECVPINAIQSFQGVGFGDRFQVTNTVLA